MHPSMREATMGFLAATTCIACHVETAGQGELCLGKSCEGDLVCNQAYQPPRCEPLGEAGALCAHRSECTSELACIAGPSGSSMCAEPIASGQACGATEECASGLICRGSPTRCLKPLAAGVSCSDSSECVEGLVCRGKPLKCAALGKDGETCYSPTECADGLRCAMSGQQGTCAPYRKDGEACTGEGQCSTSLLCNLALDGGTCARPSGPGGACAGGSDCQNGLRCVEKTCQARQAEGGACDSDDDCYNTNCNNGTQAADGTWGACMPRQDLGGPCGKEFDCVLALTCIPSGLDLPVRGTCGTPLTSQKDAPCIVALLENPQCSLAFECVLVAGTSFLAGVGECRPWVIDGGGRKCARTPGCDGLGCDIEWGEATDCVPAADLTWKDAGDTCAAANEFCVEGLTCNRGIDGTRCVAVLSGAVADPCGIAGDCRADLACDQGTGHCVVPGTAKEGESCALDFHYYDGWVDDSSKKCAEGLVCQELLDPAVCVPPGSGEAGTPCYDENDCLSQLICVADLCAPGGQSGDPCNEARPCGRGLVCITNACAAI